MLVAVVLFISSVAMVVALWRSASRNRLLGVSLLLMAALQFLAVGSHLDRLTGGSIASVLTVLTGAMWLAGAVLSLRKKRAA